jgi:DNA-binding transcriptional regulator LsrR (DeoR family)
VPSPRSHEQLAEAARLYYVDDLPQNEVARRLGTSRSNVSRILQAARETGVVKFRIQYPLARSAQLEAALVETFGVREAIVLDAGSGSSVLDRVGELAARWLVEHLVDGSTIAVSWGASLQSLTGHVDTDRAHDIDVVQLGGELGMDPRLSGHEHVRELAARIGGEYSYLHAPAIVTTTDCATSLRDSHDIGLQLKRAAAADLAVVGVGGFRTGFSENLLRSGVVEPALRDELIAADPAGDVIARFLDDDGAELDTPMRDRVLAIELDELRRIPTVVGVLSGRDKGRALRAAMRGDLLDVVVTDQYAATTAVRMERAARRGETRSA